MANERLAVAINDLLAVAKAIDARAAKKLTTVLTADQRKLHSALAAIGSEDVGRLVTQHGTAPPIPPVSDQLAPPFPTGNTATGASTSVTFACDPTSDIYDGVTTASGIASYIVNIAGVDQTAITVDGVTRLANVATAPTLFQVGSYSPAPTVVQLGRAFTLTSAGNGIDGTSDQLGLLGWQVTGDFDLYVNLNLLSGAGYAYAPGGLMWRETTAAFASGTPGARYGCIYRWLSAGNSGIQKKVRRVTNAAYVSDPTFTAGTNSARFLHISKRRTGSADHFTYRYSIDGGTWSDQGTDDFTDLSNTLVIGLFASDLQSGAQVVTCRGDGLHYTAGAQARISKTYSTSVDVNAYWRCLDAAGNVSAVGPTITGSPLAVTSSRKWFPGQYIRPKEEGFASTDSARQTSMAQIVGHSLWKGVCLVIPWGQIETSKGVYDFTQIDTDLEWCRSRGLKLIIDLWTMKFGGSKPTSFPQSAASRHIPDYLFTENSGNYVDIDTANTGYGVCLHYTYTRDRYKLLQAALAAHLDNDSAFACMILTETANAYPQYTGSNVSALHDNLENIITYCGTIWTKTPFIEYMNYYLHNGADPAHYGDTAALRMFQVMKAAKVGIGTPDMYSATSGHRYRDQGSRIHQGTWGVALQDPSHPEYGTNDYGTEVFVGKIPAAYSWEACCDYAPEDVYNLYVSTLKNNFCIWSDISSGDTFIKDQCARYYSGAALEARFLKFQFTASGGVRDYVNSRGAPNTDYPTLYDP